MAVDVEAVPIKLEHDRASDRPRLMNTDAEQTGHKILYLGVRAREGKDLGGPGIRRGRGLYTKILRTREEQLERSTGPRQ